jgi:hypothetical protein
MLLGGKCRVLILVFIFSVAQIFCGTSYFGWRPLGSGSSNGTNGSVYSLVQFGGKIVAAGKFSSAGGLSVNNIAQWDTNSLAWSSLGPGFNDTVHALYVYGSQLYAAGSFTLSGASAISRIARWNGSSWQALGSGLNNTGLALIQFGSDLIAGGTFITAGGIAANNIAKWNGTAWSQLGSGISGSGSMVSSFAIYNTDLIAGGKFSTAGGNNASSIAKWNGILWSPLGLGIDNIVSALTVYNGNLIAGGDFETAGGVSVHNIAQWNGSSWSIFGPPDTFDDNTVDALTVFNGDLIAGGGFRNAGTLYVDRVARFDGSSWNRMQTGMNSRVKALYVYNTDLYSGGEFSTAGGRYSNRIARWKNELLVSVSGTVKYSDNNSNVTAGKVKIFRLDVNSRELIPVDSAVISNGAYSSIRVPRDSACIVVGFPDDELDFVPTIFPSTIDWRNAGFINTYTSQNNINISVFRITPQTINPPAFTMGGHVFLNINPPMNPPITGNYPFLSDAIVYLKQGTLFRRFAISQTDQSYLTNILNSGSYDVFVSRIGYTTASRTVLLNTTQDTVNFYLDSLNIIGLQNITSAVPREFLLEQNYPNPFNPVTVIKFSLPLDGYAELKVYDILGRETAMLVNDYLKKGEYRYVYDASVLSSGIYFYTLSVTGTSDLISTGFMQTRKMVLIK